jgi:DNA-binding NarL/FixJ family response regulator
MSVGTGRCGHVLIADSDPASRREVTQLLHHAGFSTREAATGAAALAAARQETPSLVILEISLPDVSGYEVCRALRDEFGNSLAILFLSGDHEARDRMVGLYLGGDDYVAKPLNQGELVARVRRLVSPRMAGDEAQLNAGLTHREREVLCLLAEGVRQPEIARRLFISPKTVSAHIQGVLRKLGVHSRAEAVAAAYRRGYVGVLHLGSSARDENTPQPASANVAKTG